MAEILDELRKDYVCKLIRKGNRIDGREFHEHRSITVEREIIKRAEGSARVRIGETDVLVGMKMEPKEPFPDTPNEGIIITNAELVPLASPEFEPGPPDENSIELARVVDRGIRESGAIDLKKLCVKEGEKVWAVFIDVHVLNDDGNLTDASALGAISALLNATIPQERYGLNGEVSFPVKDTPVAVTMIEIEGNILVDPNLYEENAANSRLTVILNAEGALSGMQKSGSGELMTETVIEMVEIGIEKAEEIRKKFLLTD